MKEKEDPQTTTGSTIIKLIIICVLCISIISALVYIVQLF